MSWRIWLPSGVMMLCSLLAYIDRQTLAVLSPTILHDTGLNAEAYSQAIAAFSFAYMIANPIWGSLLDYVGLRAGMFAGVIIWTVASVSHAGMAGFWGFAAARTVLGIGEGATFPGGFRTAMDSLPPDKQSRGMALSYSGASLGALLTPLIVTPIAVWWGWRSAFWITGALGAAWLVMWWAVARPPFLPATPRKSLKLAWPDFRERRVWTMVASFGLGGFGLGVILNLSPLYLSKVVGLTQSDLGKILWIPAVGYEAGYFFWGWINDRFIGDDERRPAKLFLLLTALALPEALIPFTRSVPLLLALFFYTMFIADGFIVTSLRVGARAYPPAQTAMVGGIGSGAWSAVLALLLPVYGRWFDLERYTAVFVTMAFVPALGTLIWLGLRRGKYATG